LKQFRPDSFEAKLTSDQLIANDHRVFAEKPKSLYLSQVNAIGMFMKTATKIGIARALHHLVRSGRGLAGPNKGIFTRRGPVYELDFLTSFRMAMLFMMGGHRSGYRRRRKQRLVADGESMNVIARVA
jgi:hypothetical protein